MHVADGTLQTLYPNSGCLICPLETGNTGQRGIRGLPERDHIDVHDWALLPKAFQKKNKR